MRLALDAIRDSETLIRDWVQYNLVGSNAAGVHDHIEAWHCRIDLALSECWNFGSDLLLLNGHPPAELLDALRQRGHRRWLALASPSDKENPQPVPDCCVSEDSEVLVAFVDRLNPPYPKACARLPVHATSSAAGIANEAALADLTRHIQAAMASLWRAHHTGQTGAPSAGA
jgi:hypothetical protein